MPLLDDFLERYPEFGQGDERENLIALFISDAKSEISEKRWGKFYKRGVMALTAHLLKLDLDAKQNAGMGHRTVAGESAGELSVSYQPTSGQNGDDFYHLTAYGQEYLRLKKLVGVGLMVA